MSLLLYCIFRSETSLPGILPGGIDGSTLALAVEGELAAAYSTAPVDSLPAPTPLQAKAYAQAVDIMHRSCTVLPMRYGNVLANEQQIVELLRKHKAEFLSKLQELDGCIEMGIRMIISKQGQHARNDADARPPQNGAAYLQWHRRPACDSCMFTGETPVPHGAAYLQARRRRYAELDSVAQQVKDHAGRCRAAFDGLLVQCKIESSTLPDSANYAALLSLYFLVKKECEQPFRRAFRELADREPAKLILSGPWPPYNFA